MQGLQVELSDSLGRDELHRRTLYGFGDRLCVTEVVLLSLRIGSYVLRRHQPGIMAKCRQLPAQMMGTDASFHADQAQRHISKTYFHLATRPLLTQHNRTALIEGHNME